MSESKDSAPKTTRRRFLQIGAAVAAEALVRPVGHLSESLTAIGGMPEGNPMQRLGRFEKLLHLVAKDPNPENKDLAMAWIKFNLAEVYGTSKFPISAHLVRHFLYGLGESVDISSEYKKEILSFFNSQAQNPTDKSEEEILARFFETNLNASPFLHTLNPQDMKTLQSKQIPSSLTLRTLFQASSPDLTRALNNYTVDVIGKTVKALPSAAGFNITLSAPTFYVYDRYDWEKGFEGPVVSMDAKKATEGFLAALGINDPDKKLTDLLGKERVDKLSARGVGISDKEGALLSERGFARDFDVKARLSLSKSITFDLPNPKR